MATSVSSERAFSQGGITISKRRNRLKGDIVEALQCVKCAIRHDLLFREPEPCSVLEVELEDEQIGSGQDDLEESGRESGWDSLLIDEDEDAAIVATVAIKSPGLGRAKPGPSRGRHLRLGLTFVKAGAGTGRAKAGAPRPSRAGTSLQVPGGLSTSEYQC
jgi:hAT family C-terminal dimerisation region